MKISCTPISLANCFKNKEMNLESYINYCAEEKLDGIDILDSQCYPWQWENFDSEIKLLPKWLEKSGLKLAAYACGNNFAKLDDSEYHKNVGIVKNALMEAEAIGAPALRIFGGYHEDCGGEPGLVYHNGFEKVLQGLEECLVEAEKRGVVLALENHGRLPGHSYEIEKIINKFKSPYLKCMFDCANFMANNMDEPENPLRAFDRVKDHIVHVHVKDFGKPVKMLERRVEACVAGQGLVPLRQFLSELEDSGFEGYCSLEYEANLIVPEKEGVAQSLAYFRKIREIYNILN